MKNNETQTSESGMFAFVHMYIYTYTQHTVCVLCVFCDAIHTHLLEVINVVQVQFREEVGFFHPKSGRAGLQECRDVLQVVML